MSVTPAGHSEFCKTYRIEVALPGGDFRVFFQKVCSATVNNDEAHSTDCVTNMVSSYAQVSLAWI